MKRFIYIITGVVVFLVASYCIKAEERKVETHMINDSFVLSDSGLETAKKKALKGDAESAFRIHLHYKLGKFDTVSSFVWLEIAANHGHAIAQCNLGVIYLNVNLFKNIQLSRFWLKEAEKNGSTMATRWLKKLEESESNKTDKK